MIADLHAHYPIHLTPDDDHSTMELIVSGRGRPLRDRFRAAVVHIASLFGNYENGAVVTVPQLAEGDVRICLSVLYSPLDEMDLKLPYGSEPRPGYLQSVSDQAAEVEEDIEENWQGRARVAHSPAELDATLGAGEVALIHCVEGGFHLGDSPQHVAESVSELAALGVGYITVAHLFWRKVATSAPALPFLSDRLYGLVFPQPRVGLTELGQAAIEAMIRERVLIDLSHMSELALNETFDLLDRLDPDRKVPVLATHVAPRPDSRGQEYNLSRRSVERIAERDGVIGLILCRHIAADGHPHPKSLDDSLELLFGHIDRIHEITGSHQHAAIGSDHDGFIKPALEGLKDSRSLAELNDALRERYGDEDGEAIASGNALRLLSGYWRGRT